MKRIFGIDLVRCIAIFFVLSVHFFLNNGFYEYKVNGIGMFISIILRWTFYIGVPLFLIITGYLKKDKKLDKNHYKSILRIIISYVFISVLCIIFKHYYLHEHTRFLKQLVSIFNFSADGYSWYIEMYIGLFLLIPFLNVLYNNLKSKEDKKKLLLTLVFLISIAPLINFIEVDGVTIDIIPDWWGRIYPLLYYYIGCYIKEYGININKIKGVLVIISIVLVASICSYFYSYNSVFSTDFIGGYGSLQTVVISTILFLIIYDIKCNKKGVTKIVSCISSLSLDIYLFSYIVDKVIYNYLDSKIDNPVEYLKFYIPIVLVGFTISFILSYIKKIIFDLFSKKIKLS